jgi:hypothetical protein
VVRVKRGATLVWIEKGKSGAPVAKQLLESKESVDNKTERGSSDACLHVIEHVATPARGAIDAKAEHVMPASASWCQD